MIDEIFQMILSVQTRLAFKILANAEEAVSVEGNDEVHVAVNTAIEDRLGELCLPEKHVAKEERVIKVAVPQSDYMLGIAGKIFCVDNPRGTICLHMCFITLINISRYFCCIKV